MPAASEKQEKLMRAVAHNPEFAKKVGIPQSVGKEFSDGDIPEEPTVLSTPAQDAAVIRTGEAPVAPQAGAAGRASGILFVTDEGEVLLVRRGNGGDFPGTFGLPGGHQENDESLEECARREALEETGLDYEGSLELLYDDGQFATYIAKDIKKFDVTTCDESTGYVWCEMDNAPSPLHPGLSVAFRIASAKTETDIALLMREDVLPSPQMFANVCLLALRITGTGLAYRSAIGEHVWRDPAIYLNHDFLQRCNGLIVIMDHPETEVLTSEEFKDRAVGSIILPYIKADEVWGIAKVYDQESVNEILEGEISTSPSVVFDSTSGNTILKTENGEPLLIEGVPFLLDHLAIVTKARGSKGVWDKGGDPAGVLLNNLEVSEMIDKTNEPKADAQGDKLDAILNAVGKLSVRMDEMEKNLPAPPLVTAADKKAKKDDDDGRKDDDDDTKAKRDDDDEEEEVEKKADKKRKDAAGGKEEGPAGEIKPDDDDDDDKARKADEEEAKYADAQAKADSVYAGFGKSASRPLNGESLMAYRKRMIRGLQAYSDAYKEVNLGAIKDEALLALAEKQIFADAISASKTLNVAPAGQLIEMHEKDRGGRTITKFRGSMSAWLDDFKVPSQRVTAFHTANNQR